MKILHFENSTETIIEDEALVRILDCSNSCERSDLISLYVLCRKRLHYHKDINFKSMSDDFDWTPQKLLYCIHQLKEIGILGE